MGRQLFALSQNPSRSRFVIYDYGMRSLQRLDSSRTAQASSTRAHAHIRPQQRKFSRHGKVFLSGSTRGFSNRAMFINSYLGHGVAPIRGGTVACHGTGGASAGQRASRRLLASCEPGGGPSCLNPNQAVLQQGQWPRVSAHGRLRQRGPCLALQPPLGAATTGVALGGVRRGGGRHHHGVQQPAGRRQVPDAGVPGRRPDPLGMVWHACMDVENDADVYVSMGVDTGDGYA